MATATKVEILVRRFRASMALLTSRSRSSKRARSGFMVGVSKLSTGQGGRGVDKPQKHDRPGLQSLGPIACAGASPTFRSRRFCGVIKPRPAVANDRTIRNPGDGFKSLRPCGAWPGAVRLKYGREKAVSRVHQVPRGHGQDPVHSQGGTGSTCQAGQERSENRALCGTEEGLNRCLKISKAGFRR